ncbi:nuclease, partial [Vibrio cholerae]
MNFEITETIFSYPQSLLDDWKNGYKDWIPESLF